jgi:AcrR family transcriptional regulator
MSATRIRLPAGERRSLILAAGAAEFGEHGYDGVTLAEIAAAAGVTKPIVYRHFASKKALYLALLAKHGDDLPTFTAGGGDGGSEELRAILDTWLTYARSNAHGWQMLFRDAGGDAEVVAFRRALQDRARDVIAELLQRSSATRGAIPPAELEASAEIVRGGLAALIVWWADHPDVPQEALLGAASRLLSGVADPP